MSTEQGRKTPTIQDEPPNGIDVPRHAVVLSGGSAHGAYEVGVMKALLSGASAATDYQPLEVDIFCGTSVGAFSAAYMVSQTEMGCAAAAAELELVWLDQVADGPGTCGSGVMRIRFNPFEFLDPRCLKRPLDLIGRLVGDTAHVARIGARLGIHLVRGGEHREERLDRRVLDMVDIGALVSVEPLRKLLRSTVDLRKVRESSRQLRIAVTDWENGVLKLFKNEDMGNKIGHDIIQASCSMPGIFPPVDLIDSTYVDGGCLLNTPLKPAIRAGADAIHVVYLDLELSEVALCKSQSTFESLDRMIALLFSASVNSEISNANLINQGLALLDQVQEGATPSDKEALAFLKVAKKIHPVLGSSRKKYRPLTIHRYRPGRYLGGILGMLNFERERVEELVEEGYRDTVAHDCLANKCILVEPSAAAEAA